MRTMKKLRYKVVRWTLTEGCGHHLAGSQGWAVWNVRAGLGLHFHDWFEFKAAATITAKLLNAREPKRAVRPKQRKQ